MTIKKEEKSKRKYTKRKPKVETIEIKEKEVIKYFNNSKVISEIEDWKYLIIKTADWCTYKELKETYK